MWPLYLSILAIKTLTVRPSHAWPIRHTLLRVLREIFCVSLALNFRRWTRALSAVFNDRSWLRDFVHTNSPHFSLEGGMDLPVTHDLEQHKPVLAEIARRVLLDD